MRFNSVGFALSVGMMLIVLLIGFTLLSAAGLVGYAADDAEAARIAIDAPVAVQAPAILPVKSHGPMIPNSPSDAAVIAAGDALFKNNCAQCHAVGEQVVGPALGGLLKRQPMSWILPWVKNSSKVVASGDEYAIALFNKYNKQQMPSFALSDKEITSIVVYITSTEGQYMQVVVN